MSPAYRGAMGLARSRPAPVAALTGIIAAVLSAMPACNSGGARRPAPPDAAPQKAQGAEDFPLVTRAANGLEVRWWVADDSDGAVGRALVDLGDGAAPLPEGVSRRWIASGLRMVRIKGEDLESLQQRLPTVVTEQRTWHGWATDWTPLFTGRRLEPGPIVVDAETRRAPAGVLRLLGRAWVAPSRDGDVLRLEILPQSQTGVRDETLAALGLRGAGPTKVIDEGPVYRELAIDAALDRSHVYVIAPESPSVEWRGTGERKRPDPEPTPEAGPRAVPAPTFGEAMMAFTPDANTPGKRALKAIVVLVPR